MSFIVLMLLWVLVIRMNRILDFDMRVLRTINSSMTTVILLTPNGIDPDKVQEWIREIALLKAAIKTQYGFGNLIVRTLQIDRWGFYSFYPMLKQSKFLGHY